MCASELLVSKMSSIEFLFLTDLLPPVSVHIEISRSRLRNAMWWCEITADASAYRSQGVTVTNNFKY